MTHLLLFTAFVLWYAFHEASDDAHEIAEHREIDHVPQWLTRAAVFGSAWYLLWVLCGKPSTWLILMGHAFLFSAVFRYRLNRLRGKHWWYIGPRLAFRTKEDSWYDGLFHIVAQRSMEFYQRKIRRDMGRRIWIAADPTPGRLAYLTEITLFALGTAGAIMQL